MDTLQPGVNASPEEIVSEIFDLYQQFGKADYIGESVSQLEHMSQAAQQAMDEGYDDEVVLAAFFHDIGQICAQHAESMGGYGNKEHEELGYTYLLQKGFSLRMAELVRSHVDAKRYLCYKYPGYYDELTEASKKTLGYQGGPMSAEEATAFETHPDFALYIKLREWDDRAKVAEIHTDNFSVLKEKAITFLGKI